MRSVPYLDSPVSKEKIQSGSPQHEGLGLDSYISLPFLLSSFAETCQFPNNPVNEAEQHRYYFLLDYEQSLAITLGNSGKGRTVSGIWINQKLVLPDRSKPLEQKAGLSAFEALATSAFIYFYINNKLAILSRINGVYQDKSSLLVKSNLRIPPSLLSELDEYKGYGANLKAAIRTHQEHSGPHILRHEEQPIHCTFNIYFNNGQSDQTDFERAEMLIPRCQAIIFDKSKQAHSFSYSVL